MKITCTVAEFCELLRAGLSPIEKAGDIYFDLVKNAGIEFVKPSPVDNSTMRPQTVANETAILFPHPDIPGLEITLIEYNRLMLKKDGELCT